MKIALPIAALIAAVTLAACGTTERTVVATPGSTVVVHSDGDTRVVTH